MGCCSSRLARKGPRPGQNPTPSIAAPFLSTMPQYAEQNTGPISAQDIVFSCCVCHDTLSEVYDEPDRHLGLHHQPNQAEGRITKLYLTACAHVVCAKHLEGGGKSPDTAVKCLWPELIPSASRCTFPSVGAAPQGILPFLQGYQNRRRHRSIFLPSVEPTLPTSIYKSLGRTSTSLRRASATTTQVLRVCV